MKRILIAVVASLAMQAHAQTPAELDDYYAKKAAADAAQQVIVRANAAGIDSIKIDLAALRAQVTALEALVAKLQAAGQITQQQLDQIRLVIPQGAP
jgi:cbb3-type cytochrome oxidase cytochrome c subunit